MNVPILTYIIRRFIGVNIENYNAKIYKLFYIHFIPS